MDEAAARGHPLNAAASDNAGAAAAVLVRYITLQNKGHGLEAAVRVRAKRQAVVVRKVLLPAVMVQENKGVYFIHGHSMRGHGAVSGQVGYGLVYSFVFAFDDSHNSNLPFSKVGRISNFHTAAAGLKLFDMKNKIQAVDFTDINEFLHYLPDDHLKIVEALRALVLECIPDAKEKLSYNIPIYRRFGTICFIWPSSVQWGEMKRTGVDIGFWRGNLLSDPSYLDIGKRKQIYVKTYHNVKEIDHYTLRQLLYEAVVIDEELAKNKKKKKKKKL